jgi:hypothetical protein
LCRYRRFRDHVFLLIRHGAFLLIGYALLDGMKASTVV